MKNLTIGRKIEKGTFGKVCKGTLEGKKVAVKIIKKEILERYNVNPINEINILKKLNSNWVIRFIDYFEDEDFIYHILEYVKTDLYTLIQRNTINESQALKFVKNITRGLIYLNLNNIAHFDIKPENILVDPCNNTKITDFGHAIIFKKGQIFNNVIGTVYYLAPEIIKKSYDYRADIWSLGISYYEMINKFPPFYLEDEGDIYDLILNGKINFSDKFSKNIKKNILHMLTRNPDDRGTFLNILDFEN